MVSKTIISVVLAPLIFLAYMSGAGGLALGLLSVLALSYAISPDTAMGANFLPPTSPNPPIPAQNNNQLAGPVNYDDGLTNVEELEFRPSIPGDSYLGGNPSPGMGVKTKNPITGITENFGVGPRSGQYTVDLGPVRFKDTLRFRLWAAKGNNFFSNVANPGDSPLGKIAAFHFSTKKPVFQQKTKMLDATVEPMVPSNFLLDDL